jgi:hypothetical protein
MMADFHQYVLAKTFVRFSDTGSKYLKVKEPMSIPILTDTKETKQGRRKHHQTGVENKPRGRL